MKNDLKWTLLVLCFCGLVALNEVIDHKGTCVSLENQNSNTQGCITSNGIRNGELAIISFVFVCVFSYEIRLMAVE
jgi:hypothetical protein